MTPKITTRFFGLELSSPVIAASSSMTGNADQIKKIAEAGAGAVVLKSIFEEEIQLQLNEELNKRDDFSSDPEYLDYFDYVIKDESIRKYTKLITDAKAMVKIPVIASVNCVSSNEWISFAGKIQEAGADAIELNLFLAASDPKKNSSEHEKIYFDIISKVLSHVSIPVSIKISPYFSNLSSIIVKLSQTGVAGITLFNRFYSPDIDIYAEKVVSADVLTHENDYLLPLRWVGIMAGKTACRLAGTTGIHSAETAVKFILAGASAVQIASSVYRHGVEAISTINSGIENWMKDKGYSEIEDYRGKLSILNTENPTAWERVQFMKHFGEKEYGSLH